VTYMNMQISCMLLDENQEASPKAQLHVPVGPIARAKRIKEAFNDN
jgi:hypothetical protein